jgi:hypothetical protein
MTIDVNEYYTMIELSEGYYVALAKYLKGDEEIVLKAEAEYRKYFAIICLEMIKSRRR